MALTGLQKQALMARLSGQIVAPVIYLSTSKLSFLFQVAPVALPPNVTMIQATNCLVVKNMFDPRT